MRSERREPAWFVSHPDNVDLLTGLPDQVWGENLTNKWLGTLTPILRLCRRVHPGEQPAPNPLSSLHHGKLRR